MKTTRTSDDRFRKPRTDHEIKELSIERPRSRDAENQERICVVVVDREPGRSDDDEMFRPFDL